MNNYSLNVNIDAKHGEIFMSCKFKILFASLIFIVSVVLFIKTNQVKHSFTDESIHLNFNENPFGTSPSASAAMNTTLRDAARYPDKEAETFIAKLASYHSISPSQLLVENGLSSILRTAAETFLGNQKTLIVADPTFDFLASYAKERGGKVIKVPLNKDYSHDLETMLSHIDSSTKLIYISNPNNPTGTLTSRDQIEDFLKKLPKDVYVFIDEAYHHFAMDSPHYISFIDSPIKDDRLIVGRTFSKAYGLAGIRLGYAVSTPNTITKLKQFQTIDSNNVVALKGGLAALNDELWMLNTVKKLKEIREEFYNQAHARGLKYIPTHANFIMMETGGRSVQSIQKHFAKYNIELGREFPPMHKHIRISFGRPEQMKQFWLVWDKLPQTTH